MTEPIFKYRYEFCQMFFNLVITSKSISWIKTKQIPTNLNEPNNGPYRENPELLKEEIQLGYVVPLNKITAFQLKEKSYGSAGVMQRLKIISENSELDTFEFPYEVANKAFLVLLDLINKE